MLISHRFESQVGYLDVSPDGETSFFRGRDRDRRRTCVRLIRSRFSVHGSAFRIQGLWFYAPDVERSRFSTRQLASDARSQKPGPGRVDQPRSRRARGQTSCSLNQCRVDWASGLNSGDCVEQATPRVQSVEVQSLRHGIRMYRGWAQRRGCVSVFFFICWYQNQNTMSNVDKLVINNQILASFHCFRGQQTRVGTGIPGE